MVVVQDILAKSAEESANFKPTTVNKHLELDYDVGRLLASDPNDLDNNLLRKTPHNYLRDLTRDNVQLLMNEIWRLPTERVDESIVAKLPPAKFVLPRAQHVPTPRLPTKWEQFAAAKGIQKQKKSKLTWDEQLQKWIPNYGYRRAAAEKEKDWVLEVPQNADPYEDQFEKKAIAKSEKVAKNELQRLRNIAKAKNIKVPRTGTINPDMSSAKELQTAVTVARSSTASAGKFQSKLAKEKEATNVHSLIPGGNRKRKMPPVSSEQEKKNNLTLMDSILNKRPKIDIERAVTRQLKTDQMTHSEEGRTERSKGGRGGKKRSSNASSRKPKSGKGVHKGIGNKGRKRR